MSRSPLLVDYLDTLVLGPAADEVRVALAVPASGSLGLTRPASLAAAVLAAEEINAAGGIRGRQVRLTPVDAGQAPRDSARELAALLSARAVHAVTGFHTSDVHRALEHVTTGRVPYLFTPPHEGGRRLPGVGLLGPAPVEQLAVPVQRLSAAGARGWALLGNDYIWPRAVHRAAAGLVHACGGAVLGERLVPMGSTDPEGLTDWLASLRVDAVLLSLVGRDLAQFNRAFAASRLFGQVVRLSGALEEVGLLEIEGDSSGELYAAMDWYLAQDGDGFADRYRARWGVLAPPLGSYARGCYDGLHALARLAGQGQLDARAPGGVSGSSLRPAGAARGATLARAHGLSLVPVA